MASVTVIFSTRKGELAELITNAGSPDGGDAVAEAAKGAAAGGGAGGRVQGGGAAGARRVESLDDFDGIVVIGGDGTFFEVRLAPAGTQETSCQGGGDEGSRLSQTTKKTKNINWRRKKSGAPSVHNTQETMLNDGSSELSKNQKHAC